MKNAYKYSNNFQLTHKLESYLYQEWNNQENHFY